MARTLALRFTPAGALDTTFGGNGVVFASAFGPAGSVAHQVVMGHDGGVYLGATPFYTPPGTPNGSVDMAVARLRANGSLDTTYGSGGKTYIDFSDRSLPGDEGDSHEALFGMLLDADGALVLAGDTGPNSIRIGDPERGDAAVVRLQPADLPPVVRSARFVHEAARPTVTLRFSEPVTGLATNDVTLVNLTTGGPTPAPPMLVAMNPAGDGADIIFYPAGTPYRPLPNGNYRLTLRANAFSDSVGQPLAAAYVFEFFVLAGDVDRNRAVDGADFALLASNFGKRGMSYAQGDLNADGAVDGSDFAILAGNFGKALPAAQLAVARADAAGTISSTGAATRRPVPAPRRRLPPAPRAAASRRRLAPPLPARRDRGLHERQCRKSV
jgi:hypothetical protein